MQRIKFWLRNFFGISKSEANGLIILLPLMLLIIFMPAIVNKLTYTPVNFAEEEAQLNQLITEMETKAVRSKEPPPQYRPFDPNKVSAHELIAMGINEKVANNWQKYLEHGGKFNKKKDIGKIYGLSDSVFNQLQSYLNIEVEAPESRPMKFAKGESVEVKEEFEKKKTYQFEYKPVLIDINTADTAELKKIRGIGSVFSGRIVNYRESLGGFVTKGQLREVYGLREPLLNHMDSIVFIGSEYKVRYININEVSGDQLAKHPYLTRRAADAIISYKYQHGALKGIDDLHNIHLLDSLTITKIAPYLSF